MSKKTRAEIKEKDKKKPFVLTTSDIICYVCALVLCIVPFTPFMSEMEMHAHMHEGEIVYETSVADFIYLYSGTNLESAMSVVMAILAFCPLLVAVLIVVATITKKGALRFIMMGVDVAVTGFWIYAGNKIVAKIFTGELYEPAAGYYMLIGSAFLPIIIHLIAITKEKNKSESEKNNKDK